MKIYLRTIKYFCEDASEYYIIKAGFLLGVHINQKDFSFPVGKVDFILQSNNGLIIPLEVKTSYHTK